LSAAVRIVLGTDGFPSAHRAAGWVGWLAAPRAPVHVILDKKDIGESACLG